MGKSQENNQELPKTINQSALTRKHWHDKKANTILQSTVSRTQPYRVRSPKQTPIRFILNHPKWTKRSTSKKSAQRFHDLQLTKKAQLVFILKGTRETLARKVRRDQRANSKDQERGIAHPYTLRFSISIERHSFWWRTTAPEISGFCSSFFCLRAFAILGPWIEGGRGRSEASERASLLPRAEHPRYLFASYERGSGVYL